MPTPLSLNNPLNALGITVGTALSLHLFLRLVRDSFKPPLPPSPQSYPLIGHLLSVPQSNPHLGFIELGKQLKTKLFSLTVLGQTMVILNSEEDAINLLQNRSGIYSDRPSLPMLTEPSLMDASAFISALRYNERWRKSRRLMHPWLHKQAIESFHESQQQDARQLLQQLLLCDLTSSEALYQKIFTALSGTLLRSIYGYDIKGEDDPFLKEAIQCVNNLSEGGLPTNFLVNAFPILRYVPTWFPGAGWKQIAQEWREQKKNITMDLYNATKEMMAPGDYGPSIIASLLTNADNRDLSPEEVDDYLSQIGITLYVGKDLDALVGKLLVLTSRRIRIQKLEPNRWCPIVPLGAPHATIEDDTYQGFRIPKGTMIIGNTWAMSRDENVYGNPEKFDPDRFLDPSVPPCPIFGFGRRECPGNHFAESSLFILISSFLATFNISSPKNVSGEPIIPQLASKSAIIFHPDEFHLKLEPRSARHIHLIRNGL